VFGQVEHILGDFDVLDVVEIFLLGSTNSASGRPCRR
jgi:hypothetical protein